jgi:hypothetical protein
VAARVVDCMAAPAGCTMTLRVMVVVAARPVCLALAALVEQEAIRANLLPGVVLVVEEVAPMP